MRNVAADCAGMNDYSATRRDILAYALERLLMRHRSVLREEGMDCQIENLKRWLEDNHKDFTTETLLSEASKRWLFDICTGLKLAVEERQRLEGEGGLPSTKEQGEQNEDLLKSIQRIEKIIEEN